MSSVPFFRVSTLLLTRRDRGPIASLRIDRTMHLWTCLASCPKSSSCGHTAYTIQSVLHGRAQTKAGVLQRQSVGACAFPKKAANTRSKSRADAARGTGVKVQCLSALPDAMLLCTQPSIFSSMVTCGLQPRLRHRNLWQSRQPMRQTLVEGRSDAANTRVARHWYRTQASCLASLQTRAMLSTCSCADGMVGSRQPCAV